MFLVIHSVSVFSCYTLTDRLTLIIRSAEERTCQFICDVVYNVGIVKPPFLVLPPALDVDARFPLKIGQVEVVSVDMSQLI